MKTFVAKEHEVDKKWYLVDAENRDRKTLYVEVAKALKVHPIDSAQIDKVAKIFAKEWQKSVR